MVDFNETELDQLALLVGSALKKQNLKLTLAESCTGGLVASTITSVAGSSAWFDRGFVTYSNVSKQEMLSVSPKTIEQFGAVSEQTAKEMAVGALKHSHADLACSITGIAGPTGGTKLKPVGTVYFAWANRNTILETYTQIFNGNRQQIRHQATITVLCKLLQIIEPH